MFFINKKTSFLNKKHQLKNFVFLTLLTALPSAALNAYQRACSAAYEGWNSAVGY